MNGRAKISLLLAFGISVGVHGVAYASLSRTPLESAARELVSEVNFEVKSLPEPPPEPEPAPKAPEPVAKSNAPVVQAALPNQPLPVATATAATAAPALDLSGVTLTNDTGSGFVMPVGDGSALHGPIGLGIRQQGSASAAPGAAVAPKPPGLVAASDLSEHPRPPALGGLLRANYPEEARQRGLAGTASVRARIDPDGVIRSARLLSESSGGFGSACRRTVVGSHWSAPRDKNGGAVATEIVYTCHFEVDH